MTKADIINTVSRATGLTKIETEAVMEGIFATIKLSLKRNERVELRGFGTFGVKKRGPRKARNPGTGEIVDLPERYVPTFKPSRILKNEINKSLIM
ncbi:MAG: integration host factor subunit beta [Candidatus Marinimicrobia bacterium]|nr:integration host factor subunit beta [Candidatus Neomarinimicrobiota bacterium]